MEDVGTLLARAVEWALVPLILLLLWSYGFFQLPEEATSKAAKKSAGAARWAGMIIFVLFVLWRRGQGDEFLTTMPHYRLSIATLIVAVVGAFVGFGFSRFVDILKETKGFPLVVLVLVALMSISSYTYAFISAIRLPILFLALGFAFGTLLDEAFSAMRSETATDDDGG